MFFFWPPKSVRKFSKKNLYTIRVGLVSLFLFAILTMTVLSLQWYPFNVNNNNTYYDSVSGLKLTESQITLF